MPPYPLAGSHAVLNKQVCPMRSRVDKKRRFKFRLKVELEFPLPSLHGLVAATLAAVGRWTVWGR